MPNSTTSEPPEPAGVLDRAKARLDAWQDRGREFAAKHPNVVRGLAASAAHIAFGDQAAPTVEATSPSCRRSHFSYFQ